MVRYSWNVILATIEVLVDRSGRQQTRAIHRNQRTRPVSDQSEHQRGIRSEISQQVCLRFQQDAIDGIYAWHDPTKFQSDNEVSVIYLIAATVRRRSSHFRTVRVLQLKQTISPRYN